MGEQRNRSVLVANTVIIISYREFSKVDCQSHSCYGRWDEKDREVNHMAKKEILDKLSIYIPQKKMEEKPGERLIRLGNKKDRSINYMVVEAILEYLEREEKK